MSCGYAGKLILAVDLGSTHFKAALFDGGGRRLADASLDVPYLCQDGQRCEMDPVATRKALAALEAQTLQNAGATQADIGTTAYDSQAQTFCVLDAHERPLTPLISWLDRRAGKESEDLDRRFADEFHRHCGFPHPTALMLLSKLLWLRRHAPDRLTKNFKIASLPGYLALPRLERLVCDRNLAAMSGTYSLAGADWWGEALEVCGIDPSAMGELVNSGAPLETGSGRGIVMAGNDQTAGAYGNGCRRGELVLTLGTALVAYRFAGKTPGPFSEAGAWGPYPGGGFYELATRSHGCLALNRARSEIAPGLSPRDFDRLAETGARNLHGADPLFFPESATGGGEAWSASADLEKMAYAVLEGIAFCLRQLVQEDLGSLSEKNRFRVIGGGSRSDIWMGILADVLNAPVRRGRADSLLGAASMGAGFTPERTLEKTFHPRPERREPIESRYRAWRRASSP